MSSSPITLHYPSDRSPLSYDIAVPQGYNAEHIRKRFPDIWSHYVDMDRFSISARDARLLLWVIP